MKTKGQDRCYLREGGPGEGPGEAVVVAGLGLDLVELGRVAGMLARWGPRLLEKLMGPEEMQALPPGEEQRTLAVARAIAAKEAASKAIGTGWTRGVRWRDVVLAAGPPPAVHLLERAAAEARRLGSAGECRVRFEQRGDLLLCEVRLLGA